MASPQSGIFALGTASHAFLEFDASPADAVPLCSRAARIREMRTIGAVNVVAGFRPELWSAIAPDAAPLGAAGFNVPLTGPGGDVFPATQHDVVIWLTGAAYDVVFDQSREIVSELTGLADLAGEIVGWPYHSDRDLTGFTDGTENPTLLESSSAALAPPGSPGEGGSILLLQQWDHDTAAWDRLPVPSQEAVIGRRKADNVELDPQPLSSHVAHTDQDTFGKIVRRNVAYGTAARHGTIFVGFSGSQQILAAMLDSMIGTTTGVADRLTSFARARTGAYYVIPSADRLARLAGDSG